MRKVALAVFAIALFCTAFPCRAQAAKLARIATDSAIIYDQPSTSAKALARIRRGAWIATADTPTRGFYRMRARSGLLGWIRADQIVFTTPPKRHPDRTGQSVSSQAFQRRIFVRALSGIDLFDARTATPAIRDPGISGLNDGLGYGGELGYEISRKFRLLIRFESIARTVNVQYLDTDKVPGSASQYKMQISSAPVQVGAGYQLWGGTFSTDVDALVGYGLGTKLSATSNLSAPNETVFSAGGPAFLLKTTGTLHLTRAIGAFVELGYRILSAKASKFSKEGSGSVIFKPSGTLEPVTMNLGGPLIGAGVAVYF